MDKADIYCYSNEHDQIIHDDRQTVYCVKTNNRYEVKSTTGEIKIYCPGCGLKLDPGSYSRRQLIQNK